MYQVTRTIRLVTVQVFMLLQTAYSPGNYHWSFCYNTLGLFL